MKVADDEWVKHPRAMCDHVCIFIDFIFAIQNTTQHNSQYIMKIYIKESITIDTRITVINSS